jgi:WD40 repeat protein
MIILAIIYGLNCNRIISLQITEYKGRKIMSRSVLLLTLVISLLSVYSHGFAADEDYLVNVLGFGDLQVVSYSPDGSKIVSAGASGKVYVWDADSLSLIDTLKGNMYSISYLKFTPDGKSLIASGPKSKNGILFWDFETGEIVRTIPEPISNLIISNDGKIIAGITKERIIKVWDVSSGNLLTAISGFGPIIESIDFNQEGTILAAGCADATIKTIDIASGSLINTFLGHSEPVTTVDISEDGSIMVSGSVDKTIKIWNVDNGLCLHTSISLESTVKKVRFFERDSSVFVLCNGEWGGENVKVMFTGNQSTDKSFPSGVGILDFDLSPDWNNLIVGERWHVLVQHNVDSANNYKEAGKHSWYVETLAFTPDSKNIAFNEVNGTGIYNVKTGEPVSSYPYRGKPLSLSPDGEKMALWSNSATTYISIIEAISGKLINDYYVCGYPISSDFSPDGTKLLVSSILGLCLSEVSTGTIIYNLYNDTIAYYTKVDFSPDGLYFAAGSDSGRVKIWDVTTGKVLKTFQSKNEEIYCPVFHPGGKILASSGYGPYIEYWDIESGNLIREIKAHDVYCCSINYIPDGSMLVSGSYDSTMKIWDPNTGICLHTINEKSGWINYVAFSPDGQFIASGSEDGTVRIYKVPPPVSVADGKSADEPEGNISVYPNPASNSFIVNYTIEASGETSLTIRALNSIPVRTIFESKFLDTGSYSETVDSSILSPGMYYIILNTASGYETKKLIMIK